MPDFNPLHQPPFSEYWEREEAFSEWLADENNIHYLREALGLQGLVAEELEREVEGYYVDIYARDETFDIEVVIENQFGRSDHDHWGKANTYSSNLDADVIVWIAGEFTDGHLEAVRDHNETADRAVFALRAEIVEIQECEQAAFRLVPEVGPSDWPYDPEDMSLSVYQQHFWEQFIALAEKEGYEELTEGAVPEHSESNTQAYHLPLGEDITTNCRLTLRATSSGLAVELQINEDDDHAMFDKLDNNREEINTKLQSRIDGDGEVRWERGQEIVRDKIRMQYTEGEFDLHAVNRYDSYQQWLLSTTAALRSVFSERVRKRERQ